MKVDELASPVQPMISSPSETHARSGSVVPEMVAATRVGRETQPLGVVSHGEHPLRVAPLRDDQARAGGTTDALLPSNPPAVPLVDRYQSSPPSNVHSDDPPVPKSTENEDERLMRLLGAVMRREIDPLREDIKTLANLLSGL